MYTSCKPCTKSTFTSYKRNCKEHRHALRLFRHKLNNMKCNVMLYYVLSFSASVCVLEVPTRRKSLYQAAIFQTTNQPDNMQLSLLPGWELFTFHIPTQPFSSATDFSLSISKGNTKTDLQIRRKWGGLFLCVFFFFFQISVQHVLKMQQNFQVCQATVNQESKSCTLLWICRKS